MFSFLLGLCGGVCVDVLVRSGDVRGWSVLTLVLRIIGWREHSYNKRSAVVYTRSLMLYKRSAVLYKGSAASCP